MVCPCSWLLGISHLSLVINSSINFLLYFSIEKRFKGAAYRVRENLWQRVPTRSTVRRSEVIELEGSIRHINSDTNLPGRTHLLEARESVRHKDRESVRTKATEAEGGNGARRC